MPASHKGVTAVEPVARLTRFQVTYRVQNLDPLAIEQTRVFARRGTRESQNPATRLTVLDNGVRIAVPSPTGITESIDQHNEQPFIRMRRQQMMARPTTA
ncbi:hypothetical protein SUDANB174_07635 [Streptomyces sp. enrichment culture]